MDVRSAELVISPQGEVYMEAGPQANEMLPASHFESIEGYFQDSFIGILHLGLKDFPSLPSSFAFWQTFCRRYITLVCKSSSLEESKELHEISPPSSEECQTIIDQAFGLKGSEYLSREVLLEIWKGIDQALRSEVRKAGCSYQKYFAFHNDRWNFIGRVCFHLAENKNNKTYPFAFLATYTTHLSSQAVVQHIPLKNALKEYAGENNKAALLSLLIPVQKAAEQSSLVKKLMDNGSIFQPLAWSVNEAHAFLKQIPQMESSGLMVRVPDWWNKAKTQKPKVQITIGKSPKSVLGLDSLLDFGIELTNEGEALTAEEWESILKSSNNLVRLKGQWVEVDKDKLQGVLKHWSQLKELAKNGLSLRDGLRLLAGGGTDFSGDQDGVNNDIAEWSSVAAGEWLNNVLSELGNPSAEGAESVDNVLKQHLKGKLRPYQSVGVNWLWFLYRLRLGGCLADDMGLGKTIQVLSLLLLAKYHETAGEARKLPSLLVVPASLLGNWRVEARRFAPSLRILIAHSSSNGHVSIPKQVNGDFFNEIDLVITTYAYINRLSWIKELEWDLVILDEAQQIKNPSAKQTLAVKQLNGKVRLSLTGTPVENRISDLWSIFDFTSPGLLGSHTAFSKYAKKARDGNTSPEAYSSFLSSLRGLTQPYILRRLKSDKEIISDLPDKTEINTLCSLSKEQVKLYQTAVEQLKRQLAEKQGIERKGLVLSYLLQFKQICNHPAQYLGHGEFSAEQSGKFLRLQEICEEIAAKQEKVLVFTQFIEIIPALNSLLSSVFKKDGLTLHGETSIKKRTELVDSFQKDRGPPFFILSLKAGGTGLNLTQASHVIHFDRWWNPAVENQATDRAYRIGQKRPVMVHKFISSGSIEENIDELICSKKELSHDILKGGEFQLTELSNDDLIKIVSLDINSIF